MLAHCLDWWPLLTANKVWLLYTCPGGFHAASTVRPNIRWNERENMSALPGTFSLRPMWDQCSLDGKRKPEKRKMSAYPGDFLVLSSTVRPNAHRMKERKFKCSTGKALAPSAVRPMLAGRKEETWQEGKMSVCPGNFLMSVRCETNCSLDERENFKCSTGKALTPSAVRPMLAGWKKENWKVEKLSACPGDFFSHCIRCETNCSLDEGEKCKGSSGKALTLLIKWWRFFECLRKTKKGNLNVALSVWVELKGW